MRVTSDLIFIVCILIDNTAHRNFDIIVKYGMMSKVVLK